MSRMSLPEVCVLCLLPTARHCPDGKPGKHAGYWKCRSCGSSTFIGASASHEVTTVGVARLRGLTDAMRSWYRAQGVSAGEARRQLLDVAERQAGAPSVGIEGQLGRCPQCSAETALVSLDRRGRVQVHCGACGFGAYVGRDLGLPGFLMVFKDLAPLVLRLRKPPLHPTEPEHGEQQHVADLQQEGVHGR